MVACFVCLMMLALMPVAAQQLNFVRSPSARFHRQGNRAIPNHYIVVLDRDATGRQGDAAHNAAQVAELMPEWAGVRHERHRDGDAERHVDGDAARDGSGCAVSTGESGREPGAGEERARQRRDAESFERHSVRNGEPTAVLVERPLIDEK
jgi:hypothetical protein